MKHYEQPVIITNNACAEGVFMASGAAAGGECYTVSAYIHQRPDNGNGTYRIQVNAQHDATHHSTAQELTLSFNLPVTYVSSNGTLLSGSGSNTLVIGYSYHSNNGDNIGLGDVCVTADDGLGVTGATLSCNMTCSQHD